MKSTPWGTSQHQEHLAPGIVFHSTSSHGGIVLDNNHKNKMEQFRYSNFRNWARCWEEDCDWAVPYYYFRDEIQKAGNLDAKMLEAAIKTIKDWHKGVAEQLAI